MNWSGWQSCRIDIEHVNRRHQGYASRPYRHPDRIVQQISISNDPAGVLENTVPGFGPSLGKLVGRGESFRGRNPLYMIDGVPRHNALRNRAC